MAKKKANGQPSSTIIINKRARFDYEIIEEFAAGVVLLGWEVKSIREKKVQIQQGHVIIRHGEVWLIGSQITPLKTASTHIKAEPLRNRKLLLHKREIRKLIGATERKGFTIVPIKLFWSKQKVKLSIGLAQGKKKVDKRQDLKEKDWARQKQRLVKSGSRLS